MNLRFVEAFVWVARLKSITRSAEKLCLTQSAVSNRVAALEDELGITLLDRRERSFKLTPSGTRFLQYAGAADWTWRSPRCPRSASRSAMRCWHCSSWCSSAPTR